MCQLLDRRRHVHQVHLARTARKAYESEVRQVQVSALRERIYIGSQDRLLQGLSAALRILLDGRHLLYLQPRLLCRWRQVQQDRNQRLLQSSHQHGVLRLREYVLLDVRPSKLRQVSRLLLDVPRPERSRLHLLRRQQAANPCTVLRHKRPFEDRLCRLVSGIQQEWTAVRRQPIHERMCLRRESGEQALQVRTQRKFSSRTARCHLAKRQQVFHQVVHQLRAGVDRDAIRQVCRQPDGIRRRYAPHVQLQRQARRARQQRTRNLP